MNSVKEKPTSREILAFIVMCLAMYLGLINIQIVNSSFKEIQGGLAAGAEQISWVLTSALIAEVIMLPLSGWLCRLFSTRWLFGGCLCGFALASAGCANAWNIESMIVFRALQGFSAGALMPLVFAAVYTIFPRNRHATVMTVLSFCMVTSSAAGPMLGGWITEILSWRWMFWISVPTGLILMILSISCIRIDKPEPSLARNIDFLGISLAATSLLCLLVVLEEGRRQDWFHSSFILSFAITSAISGYLFIWRELTCKHPVVDLQVFVSRDFSLGCFYAFVFGAILYVPLFLLPLYLAEIRAIDTFQIGTIVVVLGISMVFSTPIAALLVRVIHLRWVALIGFGGMAIGTWLQGSLNSEYGFSDLILPQVVRGLASQCCWLSVVTLALSSVPANKIKNASALFNLLMRLGAAVAIAIGSNQLENYALQHYSEIADTVSFSEPPVSDAIPRLTQLFEGQYGESPVADQAGLTLLVDVVHRQALIMAFNDVTRNAALVAALALLLLPLFRGKNRHPKGIHTIPLNVQTPEDYRNKP
jgi:DHA2 family multidrug resistance protein